MTDAARKIAERVPLPEFGINTANHASIRIKGYTAAQMEALRLAVAEEALRGAEAVARKLEVAMCALKYAYGNTSGRLHDAVSKAIDEILAPFAAPPEPAPNPWREAVLDALSAVGDIRADATPAEVVRELIRREVMIATDASLRTAPAVDEAMVVRARKAYWDSLGATISASGMRAALTAALQENGA